MDNKLYILIVFISNKQTLFVLIQFVFVCLFTNSFDLQNKIKTRKQQTKKCNIFLARFA